MAFSFYNPPPIKNPLEAALEGFGSVQKLQTQQLANELSRAKLPYAAQDIQSVIENRRQEIEMKKFKLQHPDLFYPESIQALSYLQQHRPNVQPLAQAEQQENAPSMGNMTLLNGADFSPAKQLASGLARNSANASGVPGARDKQELDLNDPYIAALAQYSPGLKQQIATQLAEQKGQAAGVEEEGRKLGGYRADAINELDMQYGQLLQTTAPLDHLVDIIKDPNFMHLRDRIPFYQDKQLQLLSKTGTPEEQKMIGDFITSAGSTIATAIQLFKGSAIEKEFDLENEMNISPNDTWNTMVGKLESLETYKHLIMQRNRIAVKIMEKEHLNKGDALEKADKEVHGDEIRKTIREQLNPKSNPIKGIQEQESQSSLSRSNALLPQALSNKNNSMLSEKTIGNVTYHKINGKWFPVKGEK